MIQEKGGKTLVSLRPCQESLDGGEWVSEMSALRQETRKMVLGRSEGAKPDLVCLFLPKARMTDPSLSHSQASMCLGQEGLEAREEMFFPAAFKHGPIS